MDGDSVIIERRNFANAEAYSLWRSNVKKICFFIPGVFVNHKLRSVGNKNKRSILIDHTDEA